MRFSPRLALAASVLVLPALGIASANAAGNVTRYQSTSTSYKVLVLGTYQHDYTVTNNPCDGTITITGATPADSGYYTTETVTGSQTGGVISYHSLYNGPYNPGYTYNGSFPVGGGPLTGTYSGTVTQTGTSSTNYANHGQYVSSQGGGSDAAHSCIGMPVQSQS